MENVYKFNQESNQNLEGLSGSKAYLLREKLNNGGKLTKEEGQWLTALVNGNSFSKSGVPVMGWMFNFSDVLKTYLIKQYGNWSEYRAVNKTTLRYYVHGRIDAIQEVVEK